MATGRRGSRVAQMDTPIRIFVGSDPRQGPAEKALERSIRANTESEVEIAWMRSGDEGWGEEWNRGKPLAEYRPKSGHGWGTFFSNFRLAIPELCGYEGKGIYLDSDMLVLGDIRELWELPLHGKGAVCNQRALLDVLLIDCSHEAWRKAVPYEEMKKAGRALGYWRRKLMKHGALSTTLPDVWDCRDQVPRGCKLAHFTRMPTQPWKPWPEAMSYSTHPDARMLALWEKWSAEPAAQ